MPIYEYECAQCGGRVEALIRNQKDIPAKCAQCGGKLRKALSTFSVSMATAAKHEPSAKCATCPSAGCPHRGGM